jgi:bifunctional DNA-binding transcriptional regulator/antitoxin component of YhaV-PrlF toxin-antitoxin module
MRFLRKVGRRGVLTTPTEVREAMGIEDGDIVEFEIVGVIRRGQRTQVPRTTSFPATNPTEA